MSQKYADLARDILENIGGKDNVITTLHCYTRLRVNIKDINLVKLEEIKKLNVIGAQFMGEQLQIIIGNDVHEVYEEFTKEMGELRNVQEDKVGTEYAKKRKIHGKEIFSSIIDGIVGCMVPLIPILIASGLLKAIVLILQQLQIVSANSPTCLTLSFIADAGFYFMPVIVGSFAAKKFNTNIALGAMLGGVLIHPNFVASINEGVEMSIFGIPIYSAGYSSTVIPIILSVWVMSYVQKYISKYSPKSLRSIIEPVLTILVMAPLMLCVLAPLGAMMSSSFASALTWFCETFGVVAIALFSALVPWIVMMGMHIGVVPISIAAISTSGVDRLIMPPFLLSNFTQGAACLAVGIKAKSTELKSFAFSSAFSNIIPGVSEPGMYGITLKYKTPMWGAMIGGAAGGLYFGFTGVGTLSFLAPNIFALAGYIGTGEYSNNFLNAIIGIVIAFCVAFISTMILYKPNEKNENKE